MKNLIYTLAVAAVCVTPAISRLQDDAPTKVDTPTELDELQEAVETLRVETSAQRDAAAELRDLLAGAHAQDDEDVIDTDPATSLAVADRERVQDALAREAIERALDFLEHAEDPEATVEARKDLLQLERELEEYAHRRVEQVKTAVENQAVRARELAVRQLADSRRAFSRVVDDRDLAQVRRRTDEHDDEQLQEQIAAMQAEVARLQAERERLMRGLEERRERTDRDLAERDRARARAERRESGPPTATRERKQRREPLERPVEDFLLRSEAPQQPAEPGGRYLRLPGAGAPRPPAEPDARYLFRPDAGAPRLPATAGRRQAPGARAERAPQDGRGVTVIVEQGDVHIHTGEGGAPNVRVSPSPFDRTSRSPAPAADDLLAPPSVRREYSVRGRILDSQGNPLEGGVRTDLHLAPPMLPGPRAVRNPRGEAPEPLPESAPPGVVILDVPLPVQLRTDVGVRAIEFPEYVRLTSPPQVTPLPEPTVAYNIDPYIVDVADLNVTWGTSPAASDAPSASDPDALLREIAELVRTMQADMRALRDDVRGLKEKVGGAERRGDGGSR